MRKNWKLCYDCFQSVFDLCLCVAVCVSAEQVVIVMTLSSTFVQETNELADLQLNILHTHTHMHTNSVNYWSVFLRRQGQRTLPVAWSPSYQVGILPLSPPMLLAGHCTLHPPPMLLAGHTHYTLPLLLKFMYRRLHTGKEAGSKVPPEPIITLLLPLF